MSVDNGVAAVWLIRSYGLAAHALLVGSVAWLYWSRYFIVLVVFLIPSSRGLASDFVLGGLASEGHVLLNRLGLGIDHLAVLVLVDVGYGLLARYRSLTRSHGMLQVNLVALVHAAVIVEDNVIAIGTVRYNFVALACVVIDA